MSSTGTRKERNVQTRSSEAITEADKEFINGLKIFSESSNSVAGLAGPAANNSPKTPAGNYLAREGDSMIGPIAFGPPLNFRIVVDADNTIDIGPLNENPQYTSNIQLDDIQPNSAILDIVANAAFDGQVLVLRTFAPTVPYTMRQATLGNGGNIQTADGDDIVLSDLQMVILVFDESLIVHANTGGTWRVLSTAGGGGGTGTFISADMVAAQTANLAINDHVEYDRNTPPTGADGGIVLQTGSGQANGIFELIAGKTYFLSGVGFPTKTANVLAVSLAWYDITNGNEIGKRCVFFAGSVNNVDSQPKCEVIVTPVTDVNVELRIVAFPVGSAVDLVGFDADISFAHIFEFSGVNQGGGGGAPATTSTWKNPCRVATTEAQTLTTDFENGDTIDGISLVTGNRILIKDQSNATQNGIYTVNASGAPTRATDFDTSDEAVSEAFVAIEEGSDNKNTVWHLITNNPITIGVTSQLWEEFGVTAFPDFGQGADGRDATGQFVFDGRAGVAADYLKIWEIIDITGVVPEQNMSNMIYLPSNAANKVGRLLIVGLSNATKGGAFSDNYGASWSASTSLTSNNGYGRMAYAPNLGINGTLVVIRGILGSTSASFSMQVSTDRGTSFSNVTLDFSNLGQNFNDVIWSEEDSQFVATSKFDATHEVYTSPTGSAWTRRVTPTPLAAFAFYGRIVYSPSLGKYYVKQNGTGALSEHITSTDGITWSGPFANDSQIGQPKRIIWSEGQQKFAACGLGTGSSRVIFSDDFVTWVSQTPVDSDSAMDDIVWCPDLSLWVVIGTHADGSSSPKIFWASNDGIEWGNFPISNFRVGETLGVSNARSEIAYAQEFGYFFGCNTGFGTGERFFRTAMKLG